MDNRDHELVKAMLRVNAASLVAGKSLAEGAPLLNRLGIDRATMAAIYDTTESSVRAAISDARSVKSKRSRK